MVEKLLRTTEAVKHATRRKTNNNKALRKQGLARSVYGFDYYSNLHEYDKNKIHCSCNLCRFRSKLVKNPQTMSDARKTDSMNLKMQEYYA